MLSILKQRPVLQEQQAPSVWQKRAKNTLVAGSALLGALAGSQLNLLAELYQVRLSGYIMGSFEAVKIDYDTYLKTSSAPIKGLLDNFICPVHHWLSPHFWLEPCRKPTILEAESLKNQLKSCFNEAWKDHPIIANCFSEQTDNWYESVRVYEILETSGYAKPLLVLLHGNLSLLQETVREFQPGFLGWKNTAIYSLAGAAFAAGVVYAAIQTASWLHSALLVRAPKDSAKTPKEASCFGEAQEESHTVILSAEELNILRKIITPQRLNTIACPVDF